MASKKKKEAEDESEPPQVDPLDEHKQKICPFCKGEGKLNFGKVIKPCIICHETGRISD